MIHYVLHVMPYIGYSALITAVCFLFYRLLLRRETFFQLNRWFFLGCLVFSFLLPVLPVPTGWSVKMSLLSAALPFRTAPAFQTSDGKAYDRKADDKKAYDKKADDGKADNVTISSSTPSGSSTPPGSSCDLSLARPGVPTPGFNASPAHPGVSMTDVSASSARTDAPLTEVPAPLTKVSAQAPPDLNRDISPSVPSSIPPSVPSSVPADFADQDPAAHPFSEATPVPAEITAPHAARFTIAGLLQCLFYIYLCGVVVFGMNLILQFVTLFMRVRHRPIQKDGWYRIIETSGNGAPCSFGRYIFINPALYDDETYEQILTHEKIHVQQGHSIDIMLAELCIVVQWFNPFAWRYRKALEDNLEFLTDAAVIRNPRTDASHYQMSLLRVSSPHLPLSITSNYNQSLLKKRIIMMHIKKSSVRTTWKYFFLPPLLLGMACVFNATHAQMQSPQPHTMVKDTLFVTANPGPQANTMTKDTLGKGATIEQATVENVVNAQQIHTEINTQVEDAIALDLRVDAKAAQKMDFNMSLPNLNMNVATNLNLNISPNLNFSFPDPQDTGGDSFRSGSWMATIDGDDVDLMLKSSNGDGTSSSHFKKSEFSTLPTGQKGDFTLTRDAGTLSLNGVFDGNDGFGHYSFKENPDFVAFLRKEGVTWPKDNRLIGAFFADVKRAYVETMVQAGYTNLPLHDLIALSSMKVDPTYIKTWKDMGYTDLPVHDLIALKSMKIDGDFVKQLEDAGFTHPAVHDLIAAKSMNIDAAYAQSWKQYGFAHPEIHDLVGLKSMGIDAAYLKTWKDLGYTNLAPHELMALKSQNIDEAYLQNMKALGFDHPEPHELISLKSVGVDGAYIKELKDAGFDHLEVHDVVGLKSMGVTGAYIKQLREMGYKNLEPHDVMAFKSMNIDEEYAAGFDAMGYKNLEPHELVSFKSMGITPSFIKGFSDIGFKDIPPHTIVELKSTGVTADYIVAMKNKGFDSKDLQEYVKLKTFR